MDVKSILLRIQGISIMGTGISWKTSEPDRQIALKIISYLEDRRVLFNNYELEIPDHCVQSVLQIREFLTTQIGELKSKDLSIIDNLESLRAACRKFLDNVQDSESQIILKNSFDGGPKSWTFFTALGELRAMFGVHIAIIAAKYEIGINDDLANILPPNPDAV
jgi:hypothetical protein